jgi:cyclin-dependent kinase
MCVQARDALQHPYFDDLDKEEVDKLENEAIRVREG